MKKIIVAVDSFKGSMTSSEAGNAIKNGIRDIHPDWNITVYPVADGGEGTLEALTYQGAFQAVRKGTPYQGCLYLRHRFSGGVS